MNLTEYKYRLANKFFELRKRFNLTQEELSEITKVSRSTIANIERGRQKLPLEVLLLFCSHVGIQPSEVYPEL